MFSLCGENMEAGGEFTQRQTHHTDTGVVGQLCQFLRGTDI